MQRQKIVITLEMEELQNIERIVADRDASLAVEFVTKVIKPKVDAARDRGHCEPIFEWRHREDMKVEPPPIENAE